MNVDFEDYKSDKNTSVAHCDFDLTPHKREVLLRLQQLEGVTEVYVRDRYSVRLTKGHLFGWESIQELAENRLLAICGEPDKCQN